MKGFRSEMVEEAKSSRENWGKEKETTSPRMYFFFNLRQDVPVHRFDVSVHEG